jgi:hypothetical protein
MKKDYTKRICLSCEKETLDAPCPYCGGGVFKDFGWKGELENFLKDSSNFDIMQEDIRGGIDREKLHNFIEHLLEKYGIK